MAQYDLHEVTTKAALYIHTDGAFKAVAVQHYPGSDNSHYGLPGGHIDAGETPDEAIHRELREELGVEGLSLRQASSWRHTSGKKIVLGYSGILESEQQLRPPNKDVEKPVILSHQELLDLAIDEGYRRLVLDNWPAT